MDATLTVYNLICIIQHAVSVKCKLQSGLGLVTAYHLLTRMNDARVDASPITSTLHIFRTAQLATKMYREMDGGRLRLPSRQCECPAQRVAPSYRLGFASFADQRFSSLRRKSANK